MLTAKEQIAAILERQPDDSSYEELLRELAFERMIQRGLADSDNGRVLTQEQLESRLAKWLR